MTSVSVCEESHVCRCSHGGTCQGENVRPWDRRGPVYRGFFQGRVASRAFQSILGAAGLFVMVAGHEVVAEEAGTSPTCTGCEGPSPGAPPLHKPSHPKVSTPSKPAKPTVAAGAWGSLNGSWSGVSSGACILTWPWTV